MSPECAGGRGVSRVACSPERRVNSGMSSYAVFSLQWSRVESRLQMYGSPPLIGYAARLTSLRIVSGSTSVSRTSPTVIGNQFHA